MAPVVKRYCTWTCKRYVVRIRAIARLFTCKNNEKAGPRMRRDAEICTKSDKIRLHKPHLQAHDAYHVADDEADCWCSKKARRKTPR